MDLGVSGLASGFDWRALVDKLVEVERVPEQRMLVEQNTIAQRNNAFSTLKTQLSILSDRVGKLKEASYFSARLANSSDSTVASAAAAQKTPLGSYTFNIQQLASASLMNGATNVSAPISSTADVSGLLLSDAAFGVPIKEGVLTVNGRQINILATESLQSVFDKISSATSGAVTAAYSPATDRITLSSSGEIVLGSATDTSNFFSAARLSNNGTGTVTSSTAAGGLKLTGPLSGANFSTPLASGQGEFRINGVTITFDPDADTLTNVLERINSSAAGVTASYDPRGDRLLLVNKVTGDLGIALEDVTGNFLAASGLASGDLQRGKDLLYSIHAGEQLSSHSNTITEASSGINGLSVTVIDTGKTSVTVASDTSTFKKAIQDFIEEYNKVQKLIDTQTVSTTDAQGKVTAGVLAGDSDASEIASRLRSLAFSSQTGLTGTFKSLADLGFQTNGNDNTLTLDSEAKLDAALATGLAGVEALFSDTVNGVAAGMDKYLQSTIGDEGTLVAKQALLTKQSGNIDTQITDMERLIADRRQQLIDGFLAMELAQSRANQQLSFLQQKFGGTTTSK